RHVVLLLQRCAVAFHGLGMALLLVCARGCLDVDPQADAPAVRFALCAADRLEHGLPGWALCAVCDPPSSLAAARPGNPVFGVSLARLRQFHLWGHADSDL